LSGDELKAEQGIILTQLAFIKQLRETNAGEATKLYDDVQNQPYPSFYVLSNLCRSVDSATRAIALNNQLSIEPRANPFENYRLHAAAAHAFASSKPFLAQSLPFSSNSLLLSQQAHKSKNTSEIKRHRKLYPLDYFVSSTQLYNELNGLSETALLKKLDVVFHRDETDVAAGLMLIQVQMQKGNTQMAAATLEKLFHALKDVNEVKYAPGLVSVAVLLFPKVGKDDKATALLMEAMAYWNNKQTLVLHFDVIPDSRIPMEQLW
jgi:signal recognition particle subunit SRP72